MPSQALAHTCRLPQPLFLLWKKSTEDLPHRLQYSHLLHLAHLSTFHFAGGRSHKDSHIISRLPKPYHNFKTYPLTKKTHHTNYATMSIYAYQRSPNPSNPPNQRAIPGGPPRPLRPREIYYWRCTHSPCSHTNTTFGKGFGNRELSDPEWTGIPCFYSAECVECGMRAGKDSCLVEVRMEGGMRGEWWK